MHMIFLIHVQFILNTEREVVYDIQYNFYYYIEIIYFFPPAQQPKAVQGRLNFDLYNSHAVTPHIRHNSSGREMGPSQRPLLDNTQHS